MARFLRAIAYLGLWLLITLTGAIAGAWWPVRNVSAPWAGDGMGMLMFGATGFFIGAILGVIAVGVLRARTSRAEFQSASSKADSGSGGV